MFRKFDHQGCVCGSEHYEGNHSGTFTSPHRDSISFCERCCAVATFTEHASELEKPKSSRGVNGIGITHHLSNDMVASNLSHSVSADSTRRPHLACFSSSCNHLPVQKIKPLYVLIHFFLLLLLHNLRVKAGYKLMALWVRKCTQTDAFK